MSRNQNSSPKGLIDGTCNQELVDTALHASTSGRHLGGACHSRVPCHHLARFARRTCRPTPFGSRQPQSKGPAAGCLACTTPSQGKGAQAPRQGAADRARGRPRPMGKGLHARSTPRARCLRERPRRTCPRRDRRRTRRPRRPAAEAAGRRWASVSGTRAPHYGARGPHGSWAGPGR